MSLVESLRKDMFTARKDADSFKADILNMAIASIKNVEIEKGELSDEQVIEILRKELKKLQDAYNMFTQGGRDDLAAKEKAQMDVISQYVPALMSEDEVKAKVKEIISGMGEVSAGDMGRVMGEVMKELKGKADGAVVNKAVRELLS